MNVQIGLLTWTHQDSWHWGMLIVQAGYILRNADPTDFHQITPSTWVIVLPAYLSPRACTFLGNLTTRTLLITPQINEGVVAARLSQQPCCIAHPHRVQSSLAHYLDLIQHLTSGILTFA